MDGPVLTQVHSQGTQALLLSSVPSSRFDNSVPCLLLRLQEEGSANQFLLGVYVMRDAEDCILGKTGRRRQDSTASSEGQLD